MATRERNVKMEVAVKIGDENMFYPPYFPAVFSALAISSSVKKTESPS